MRHVTPQMWRSADSSNRWRQVAQQRRMLPLCDLRRRITPRAFVTERYRRVIDAGLSCDWFTAQSVVSATWDFLWVRRESSLPNRFHQAQLAPARRHEASGFSLEPHSHGVGAPVVRRGPV